MTRHDTPNSTTTRYVQWYPDVGVLEVEYRNVLGAPATYSYVGVPRAVWERLHGTVLAGGSVGKYLQRYVKGSYSSIKGAWREPQALSLDTVGRVVAEARRARGAQQPATPTTVSLLDLSKVRREIRYAGYEPQQFLSLFRKARYELLRNVVSHCYVTVSLR